MEKKDECPRLPGVSKAVCVKCSAEEAERSAEEAARKERLELFKKAAAEGKVVIGNAAYHKDKGNGSVRAWIGGVEGKYFGVEYSIPGFGFGGFSFEIVDKDPNPMEAVSPTGRISVNSEMMSRQFVKDVLCRLVDEADWDHDETPENQMRNPHV